MRMFLKKDKPVTDESKKEKPPQVDLDLELVKHGWGEGERIIYLDNPIVALKRPPTSYGYASNRPDYTTYTPIRLTTLLSQILGALTALGCKIEQVAAMPAVEAKATIVVPKKAEAPESPKTESAPENCCPTCGAFPYSQRGTTE